MWKFFTNQGNEKRTLPPAIAYSVGLPVSPIDGEEAILVDSTTNPTYQWRFRYNAGSGGTYKWEFVGGSPLMAEVVAIQTITSTSYVSQSGPSVTVPRSGIYQITVEAEMLNATAANIYALIVAKIGAAAGSDVDAATINIATTAQALCMTRNRIVTCVSNDVIQHQTRVGSNQAQIRCRVIKVVPIRVV